MELTRLEVSGLRDWGDAGRIREYTGEGAVRVSSPPKEGKEGAAAKEETRESGTVREANWRGRRFWAGWGWGMEREWEVVRVGEEGAMPCKDLSLLNGPVSIY